MAQNYIMLLGTDTSANAVIGALAEVGCDLGTIEGSTSARPSNELCALRLQGELICFRSSIHFLGVIKKSAEAACEIDFLRTVFAAWSLFDGPSVVYNTENPGRPVLARVGNAIYVNSRYGLDQHVTSGALDSAGFELFESELFLEIEWNSPSVR